MTQEEVIELFRKLAPSQQRQAFNKRIYDPARFIRDVIKTLIVLKSFFIKKMMNYRISQVDRTRLGAYSKTRPS